MSVSHRATPLWLRFASLGVGLLILFWLPREDTHINTVNVLALLIATLFSIHAACKIQPSTRPLLRGTQTGLLGGISITPIALLLMAFKTGLHGHGVPDFSPAQIRLIINRTPYFVLGGLLIGIGSALWRTQQKTP